MLGYFVILLFACVAAFVFWLLVKKHERDAIKHIKDTNELSKLLISSAEVHKSYINLKLANKFCKYPLIENYIVQNQRLLLAPIVEPNDIKVVKNKDIVFLNGIKKEIQNAPQKVLDCSLAQLEIMERILKIKKPILYGWISLKKIIALRILECIVGFVRIMIKLLDIFEKQSSNKVDKKLKQLQANNGLSTDNYKGCAQEFEFNITPCTS